MQSKRTLRSSRDRKAKAVNQLKIMTSAAFNPYSSYFPLLFSLRSNFVLDVPHLSQLRGELGRLLVLGWASPTRRVSGTRMPRRVTALDPTVHVATEAIAAEFGARAARSNHRIVISCKGPPANGPEHSKQLVVAVLS